MRRRDFLPLLGALAGGWPHPVRGQQKAMPVIGFLGIGSPGPVRAPYLAAFRQGLSEAGHIERQNLAIEYRWAEGSPDRLPRLAADLVGRKVDVIVTQGGTLPALAAKGATSVAARPGETGDQALLDRVAAGEDDRDRRISCMPSWVRSRDSSGLRLIVGMLRGKGTATLWLAGKAFPLPHCVGVAEAAATAAAADVRPRHQPRGQRLRGAQ